MNERAAVFVDNSAEKSVSGRLFLERDRRGARGGSPRPAPKIARMPSDRLRRKAGLGKVFDVVEYVVRWG